MRQVAKRGGIALLAMPDRAFAGIGAEPAALLAGQVAVDACSPKASAGDPATLTCESEWGIALVSAGHLPGTRYLRCSGSVDAADVQRRAGAACPRRHEARDRSQLRRHAGMTCGMPASFGEVRAIGERIAADYSSLRPDGQPC